jgi:hypothetical protein
MLYFPTEKLVEILVFHAFTFWEKAVHIPWNRGWLWQSWLIDKATAWLKVLRSIGKAIPPGSAANQESDSLVRTCEPDQRVRLADQESEYFVRHNESNSRHISKSEPMSGVRRIRTVSKQQISKSEPMSGVWRIRKSDPAADQEQWAHVRCATYQEKWASSGLGTVSPCQVCDVSGQWASSRSGKVSPCQVCDVSGKWASSGSGKVSPCQVCAVSGN